MSHSEIDHDVAATEAEREANKEDEDRQNVQTISGGDEIIETNEVGDEANGNDNDAGNKDNDNEDDVRQSKEEIKDTDEEVEKNNVADQVAEDRPEEENVITSAEEDKEDEEQKDVKEIEENGEVHEDHSERESKKEEAVVADEQTELQEDKTNNHFDKPDLTEEERTRLVSIFTRRSVNGRLDLKGFKVVTRLLGEVISSNEAEEIFEEGDKDDDRTIDLDEFCRLYVKYRQEEHHRKQAVLESIDKLFPGSDGESVELKKVEQLLMKLQRPDLDTNLCRERSDLGENDIRQLVRSMDADGSGRISRQEFVNALCQHIDV